jgi:adenine deaminase
MINHPNVEELDKGLKEPIKANDIPPIKVTQINGEIFTLDNRRLAAFQEAGIPIRYELATPEEVLKAYRQGKFTTINGGTSIRIRRR